MNAIDPTLLTLIHKYGRIIEQLNQAILIDDVANADRIAHSIDLNLAQLMEFRPPNTSSFQYKYDYLCTLNLEMSHDPVFASRLKRCLLNDIAGR